MKNNLTFVTLCFTMILNAQWINDTSCSRKASLITNKAIEYAMNLEYMAAFGAASSALLIDEDCGGAKLTLAAISSNNTNWGSRYEKLKVINTTKLSPEEKGWYQYLVSSSEDREAVSKSLVNKFPKSALMNYLGTSPQDFNSFKIFAEKFPLYASSAYNMMSYGYMRGDYGKKDTAAAMKYIKMSQNMHDGPNSHDSMGEHYAANGDYENALNAELKAVDYATFASPYMKTAQLYYAKKNKKSIGTKVIAHQESMQKAIMSGDSEAYKKFEHPEIKVSAGDSNLNPFYIYSGKDVVIGKELNNLSSPDEAVFYTSGRTSNEAAFLYQLFVRQFGTNNLPDCSNMCHESSGAALTETLGIGKGSVTLEDFKHTDLVIVIGQNPGTNHPRMLSALGETKKMAVKLLL